MNNDAGSEEPLKRSRSTGPLIPGTLPAAECCQNVQPLPPQPPAGTVGAVAVVQCAIQSTAYPFRANQSVSAMEDAQKAGFV